MEQKESVLMQTILGGVKQLHYAPDDINDAFSNQVFDLYVDRIDSGRRWFTTSDVAQLEQWRSKIDDGIVNPDYEFFEHLNNEERQA